MSTPSAASAASHIHQLRFARGGTMKLINDIPEDKLCAQLGPVRNHAMYVIGHLACTDDYFLGQFTGQPLALSEEFHQTFGADPTSEASKYPPFAEVKRAFDERREALIHWLEGLSAERLIQPSPEKWQKYAPRNCDLALFLAWHEGYHGGQISAVRPGLGLGPAFG